MGKFRAMTTTKPATPSEGLAAAISVAGSQSALAKLVGISQTSVFKWVRVGAIPFDRVLEVEAATLIPREELRPDLFNAPRPRKRKTA